MPSAGARHAEVPESYEVEREISGPLGLRSPGARVCREALVPGRPDPAYGFFLPSFLPPVASSSPGHVTL